jgi:PAS domain S-box-containing protein
MDARHQEIARCLFRESNDALFIFDPGDHAVVDVNPAALRLTGFDKDVVCAKRLRDLFTSSEPAGLGKLVAAYRRTGYYHSREGYYLGRAAGEPIPVNVSVSRIHTTPDPLGLVVARDISERIHAQEACLAERRLRGRDRSGPHVLDRPAVRRTGPPRRPGRSLRGVPQDPPGRVTAALRAPRHPGGRRAARHRGAVRVAAFAG